MAAERFWQLANEALDERRDPLADPRLCAELARDDASRAELLALNSALRGLAALAPPAARPRRLRVRAGALALAAAGAGFAWFALQRAQPKPVPPTGPAVALTASGSVAPSAPRSRILELTITEVTRRADGERRLRSEGRRIECADASQPSARSYAAGSRILALATLTDSRDPRRTTP